MPHFIIKLFETIDTLILHKIYKLNDFFMENLNKIIIESVNDFFGIEITNSN